MTEGSLITDVRELSSRASVIDFKGDWCSKTNAPATDTCADAVRFTADFAASAVTIQ